MLPEITEEFRHALDLIENTSKSVFITGKAGTGKSTLLRHFLLTTNKKVAVIAPTGIAALNVGGQTIHSFFGLPPTVILPGGIHVLRSKIKVMNQIEVLVIDEVSMVRSDVMKGIDLSLRKHRKRMSEAFGGVQMVFVGDLFQLPPVLRDDEYMQLHQWFQGMYFFDALPESFRYELIELTRVFRQGTDEALFLGILNRIRTNELRNEDLELLNQQYNPYAELDDHSIFLTARRDHARMINERKLSELSSPPRTYAGRLTGKFKEQFDKGDRGLEQRLPAPLQLTLKAGAKVMMLKNDSEKRFVNGTIAWVKELEEKEILIATDEGDFWVRADVWQDIRYAVDKKTGELREEVLGSFHQFPMQLAYAVTIHKSQGKTFDRVTIDIGKGAFAHGQLYVALSRCTSLEGITLNKPIRLEDVIVDERIAEFQERKT